MTHPPPKASIEKLTNAALQAEREKAEAQLSALRDQYQQLSGELQKWASRVNELNEETDRRRLSAMATEASPDWAYLLDVGAKGDTSTRLYKASNEAVAALARVQDHCALRVAGYFPKTQQRAIQLALVRGSDSVTQAALAGLETLLPHLKPVEDFPEKGREAVIVEVRGSTLSESGVYQLMIDQPGGYYALSRTSYGVRTVLETATSLPEILAYIQKRHPYKGSLTESEEGEN